MKIVLPTHRRPAHPAPELMLFMVEMQALWAQTTTYCRDKKFIVHRKITARRCGRSTARCGGGFEVASWATRVGFNPSVGAGRVDGCRVLFCCFISPVLFSLIRFITPPWRLVRPLALCNGNVSHLGQMQINHDLDHLVDRSDRSWSRSSSRQMEINHVDHLVDGSDRSWSRSSSGQIR